MSLTSGNEFNLGLNEDSNASFPSPAAPSEDSQGNDSMQGFPRKPKERKRTASGNCKKISVMSAILIRWALGVDDVI